MCFPLLGEMSSNLKALCFHVIMILKNVIVC